MNFTRPTNASIRTSDKHRKRVYFGRFMLKFLGGLLLLMLLLLLAAPPLLSTSFVREHVLTFANEKMNGSTVHIEHWSLSWFDEQDFSGITYIDPKNGIDIKVKQIRASSLWELLPLGKMKVNMTIDSPNLMLTIAKQSPTVTPIAPSPSPQPIGPIPSPSPTPSQAITKEVPAPFRLPDLNLSARLMFLNATVQTSELDEPLVQKGNIEIALDGLDKVILTKVNTQLLDAMVNLDTTLEPLEKLVVAKTPAAFLQTLALQLTAPWAKVTVNAQSTGALPYPEGRIESTVYLPQLMKRLTSLKVPLEGVTFNGGTLAFNLGVARGTSDDALRVDATITTDGLDYVYQGARSRPKASVAIDTNIVHTNLFASEIVRLETQLPGLVVMGAGSLVQGNLTAEIDSHPLFEALKPFVKGPELPQPLKANIKATATPQSATLEFSCTSKTAKVASVTLLAKGVDIAKQYVKELTLTSSAELQTLSTFVPKMNVEALRGTAYCNATASGSPTLFKSKVLFGINNTNVQSATWTVRESKLLTGSCSIEYTKEKGFEVQNLKVDTPAFNFTGKATYQLGLPFAQSMTTELTGKVNPAYPFEHWRVWRKDEKPLKLAGTLALQLHARPVTSTVLFPNLELEVTSDEMTVTPPNQPPISTPLTLHLAVQATDIGDIILRTLTFDTQFINLSETTGTYTQTGNLSLDGILSIDFTTLWSSDFFNDLRAKNIAIAGRSRETFSFRAPLTLGAPGLLTKGEASAKITFDRLTVPTLDIPNGSASFTFKKGIGSLDFITEINDGLLHAQPQVNLTTTPYHVTLPENTHLLKDMNVTQKMVDEGLKFISPLLPGTISPRGKINLYLPTFEMLLDNDPLASLKATIDIQTSDLSFAANDMTKQLVTFLRKEPTLHVSDQKIHVTINNGKLITENLALRLHNTQLTCRGTTDLKTQQIDYLLQLPLTRELIGGSVTQNSKTNEILTLPITGTVNKPQIKLDALQQSALNTARNVATAKLNEKIQKEDNQTKKKSLEALRDILEGSRTDGETDEPLRAENLTAALDALSAKLKEREEKKKAKENASSDTSPSSSESDKKKKRKEEAKDALESALRGLFG